MFSSSLECVLLAVCGLVGIICFVIVFKLPSNMLAIGLRCPCVRTYVRTYVRLSVRACVRTCSAYVHAYACLSTESFFDFNEIWRVGRGQ